MVLESQSHSYNPSITIWLKAQLSFTFLEVNRLKAKVILKVERIMSGVEEFAVGNDGLFDQPILAQRIVSGILQMNSGKLNV